MKHPRGVARQPGAWGGTPRFRVVLGLAVGFALLTAVLPGFGGPGPSAQADSAAPDSARALHAGPQVGGRAQPSAPEDKLAGGDPFGERTPILVVMDTSGSMSDPSGVRGTRIQAARSATLDLIGALRIGHPFGLVSYPGGTEVHGCSTGTIQHALKGLDPITASAAVRRLTPDGDTPTGPALNHARQILESAGYVHGTIVLVSDGEANCGRGPCAVAKSIRSAGFDIVVNTVGFDVEGQAQDELTCVADTTGGQYISVTDEEGLTEALASAATAHLSVSVNAPDSLAIAAGDGAAGDAFEVTVTSDGRFPAADARVTLAVNAGGDLTQGILVPTPVRFLGNLATGEQRTVSLATRPDQTFDQVTWTVTVTARNARPVRLTGDLGVEDTLDRAKLGGLFDGVDRVAVVGDSYSSGEGAGDYEGTPTNCHRSFNQYAALLWGKGATNLIACSGAVTADFWRSQDKGGGTRVTPQLLKLRAEAVSPDSPQAVFVSIGGNDAQFSRWGLECALFFDCDLAFITPSGIYTSATLMLEYALAVQQDVGRVIRAIDATVNDEEALAARDGQVAPIVVLPYPRIMPRPDAGAAGCFFGFSTAELNDVNAFLDALNNSIALGAYQWRNGEGRRRPVYVVDAVIESFQPDHTICEGEDGASWARTYTRDMLGSDGLPAPLVAEEKQELLHPNADGHKAMARAIVAWSNTAAARPVHPHLPAPAYDTISQDIEGVDGWLRVLELPPATLVPESVLVDSSGDATLQASGFAPQTQVVLQLQSTPTTLGSAIADENGDVRVTVRIPRWTEAGLCNASR